MGVFDSLIGVADTLTGSSFSGATCELMKTVQGEYNPVNPSSQSSYVETETINCSPALMYNQNQIDGTRIVQGDLHIIVSYLEYQRLGGGVWGDKPTTDLRVTIQGRELSVISINTMATSNNIAAWEIQLR